MGICTTKKQFVIELVEGVFAAPKLEGGKTQDLYSAKKFWSLEEATSFAESHYNNDVIIRTVKTEYTLQDTWSVKDARKKIDKVILDIIS